MKSKVLLFLLSLIIDIFGMESKSNNLSVSKPKIFYEIKCPKVDCNNTLYKKNKVKLALLILKHIYSEHSHPDLYKDFTQYTKEKLIIKPQGCCEMNCCYCRHKLTEQNSSLLTQFFMVHVFTKHNKTGFSNMMKYVNQEARIIEL